MYIYEGCGHFYVIHCDPEAHDVVNNQLSKRNIQHSHASNVAI